MSVAVAVFGGECVGGGVRWRVARASVKQRAAVSAVRCGKGEGGGRRGR